MTKRSRVGDQRSGFRADNRFTFEVTDDSVARTLRSQAAANGRPVEAELDELVQRNYRPTEEKSPAGPDENWVDELIRITRPGFDFDPFEREPISFRDGDP